MYVGLNQPPFSEIDHLQVFLSDFVNQWNHSYLLQISEDLKIVCIISVHVIYRLINLSNSCDSRNVYFGALNRVIVLFSVCVGKILMISSPLSSWGLI